MDEGKISVQFTPDFIHFFLFFSVDKIEFGQNRIFEYCLYPAEIMQNQAEHTIRIPHGESCATFAIFAPWGTFYLPHRALLYPTEHIYIRNYHYSELYTL